MFIHDRSTRPIDSFVDCPFQEGKIQSQPWVRSWKSWRVFDFENLYPALKNVENRSLMLKSHAKTVMDCENFGVNNRHSIETEDSLPLISVAKDGP